jgi:hypothetical protein
MTHKVPYLHVKDALPIPHVTCDLLDDTGIPYTGWYGRWIKGFMSTDNKRLHNITHWKYLTHEKKRKR